MRTENLTTDMQMMASNFDFSNLPKNHELFDEQNRSKLFRFKEELGLKPILRYVGLASKVYCLQIACCHQFQSGCDCSGAQLSREEKLKYSEKLVCKGSSKFSMNNITFHDYLSCLESQTPKFVQDFRIISKNQRLTTNFFQKIAFSGFDDKRYLLDCGIHSYPFDEANEDRCFDPECYNIL